MAKPTELDNSPNKPDKHTIPPIKSPAKNKSKMTVKIENVVSTFKLNCELDLKHITLTAKNTEYNPRKFSAIVMRLRSPKTTALLFASGKVIVTGSKNEKNALKAARKYARIIHKLSYPVRFTDYLVQNIVARTDFEFPIQLDSFAMENENFCSYEPELFPGLIYRMKKPKVVLNIFVSGKVIITGGKNISDIQNALEIIRPKITEFRKTNEVDDKLVDIDDLAF